MSASIISPLLEVAAKIEAQEIKFIVDTGAAISIVPKRYLKGAVIHPTNIAIVSANGQNIQCSGQATLQVVIHNLRRDFTWTFIIAETTKPLLGYDFLNNFGLLVDCTKHKLIDPTTNRQSSAQPSPLVMNISFLPVNSAEATVRAIMDKYPNLISPHRNTSAKKTKVYHRIETGSNPATFSKTRQLSAEKCEIAKNEFRKLLEAGIISPSKSEWSSALHMVPKSDGTVRPVGDYRHLNSISKVDRYQVPNINSLSTKLHGKSFFSKIDLSSAYHQIPVHPDDICKTAVTTPFGLFEYNYMPFGLRNASSTFQRIMDSIFSDIDCTFVYIDDILIFSDSELESSQHLNQVLQRLNDYDLKITLSKCVFEVTELEFLGFDISSKGIKPSSRKLEQLRDFPIPNDSKSLRRFLGMANFYRRLVPNFSDLVVPLTECIRLHPNSKHLQMPQEAVQAIESVKNVLSSITPLSFPSTKVTNYQLVTDSSNYAVGAALHQMIDGQPVPIGFFSKKLSQTQQKYSTFDRELLAAYLAVLHFKPQIEGRNVLLLTDHKPLCSAFKSQSSLKSDRQQRHLCIITEYVGDISHIKGSQNIVADFLSRPANAVTVDICDLPELASHQATDEEIILFRDQLKPYSIGNNKNILCDVSLPFPRPFVTQKLRKSVFDSLHQLSHPGIGASLKLITSRYFWPKMNRHIKTWCKECQSCQEAKITRHTKSAVHPFDLPSPRFHTIHVDIVGPLPQVQNLTDAYFSPYRYLLTCIDRNTRWIEACPLTEISAKAVARAFVEIWISRFGVPLHIVTDRGTQFESELFAELSKIVGFHRLRTTSYHPQSNGLIERAHRTIKTAMIARKESWLSALPIVLLGIRITPNESTYSPFTAVTGSNAQIPRLLLDSNQDTNIEASISPVKELAEEMLKFDTSNCSKGHLHSKPVTYVPNELKNCKFVWLRTDRVRKSLEAPYTGPYMVIDRGDKLFTIRISEDVQRTVSIDRLKPAFIAESSQIKKPVISDPNKSKTSLPNTDEIDENQNVGFRSKSGRRVKWKKENSYFYF